MDDRIYWKAGDQLHIQAHKSRPNCGLTYGNKKVIAAEAGCSGGWDVWDSLDGNSFYGFSVEENLSGD